MLGKSDKNPQLILNEVPMVHFIDPSHELCQLVKKINWDDVEKDFARYYSTKGAPSIPVRIIVGLILLKQVYRYSDKSALGQWMENPYWQHFCGQVYFQHKSPFYFSDFSHFRRRIGTDGVNRISQLGNKVFGNDFEKGLKSHSRHDKSNAPGGIVAGRIHRLGEFLMRISAGNR